MAHKVEGAEPGPLMPPDPVASPQTALSLPLLAASIVLIALGALAIVSLVAICVVLALYAKLGADGLNDLYEDLRFDLAFKTEIGAIVVGMFYAGIALATIGAARWRNGKGWRPAIAWVAVSGRRRPVLVIAAAILAYAAVTTHLLNLARHHFGVDVIGPTDYVLLGTFAANLVLLAPFAEETFFRGWLFTNMRRRLSFWPSYLTTATLFAAIHWDANRSRALLILPLALALGLVREVTGSIKPTIALHVAYNLIIVTIRLLET